MCVQIFSTTFYEACLTEEELRGILSYIMYIIIHSRTSSATCLLICQILTATESDRQVLVRNP